VQLLGGNAWNDQLRGPQAGGRRQLAVDNADAAPLVNAAGFFIPSRSWSTTARSSTTPTSSCSGIFFTQTVARGIIEHGRGGWATPNQGWRPCGEHSHDAAAERSEARSTAAAQPNDGRHEVNQTCDRCGPAVRAAYRVGRQGELYLCGHCASHHWSALSAQGWTIWPAGEHAVAPQANH
jgi:hypothetical protein